jgi:hypothetical protein
MTLRRKSLICSVVLALGVLSLAGAPATQAATSSSGGQEFRSSVPKAARAGGFADRLSLWTEKNGQILVGLTKINGDELASLKSALGPNVSVFQHDALESMVKKTPIPSAPTIKKAAPPSKHKSTVTTLSSATPGDYPPFIDSLPYYGSDRIERSDSQFIYQCTVTSPFVDGSGNSYMMTAGHCGGTAWNQGYYDTTTQTIYESGTMGNVTSVQWGNNRIDGEILNGNNYDPYVWTNGVSGDAAHVLGTATVTPGPAGKGTPVCTDGSFTLFACGATVTMTNACVNETDGSGTTYYVCGQDIADAPNEVVQHGDSGGPVLVQTSSGMQLAGTISGGNSSGTEVNFSDVNYLQQVFSMSVMS